MEKNSVFPIYLRLSCIYSLCGFAAAGRKALESLSPGLQPGAIPSQLPAPINDCSSAINKKSPVSFARHRALCSRRPKADVTCAGETRRIHLANHYPPDSRGSSIEPLDNVWYSVRKVAGVGGTRVAQQTISRHHSVEWARNTLFRSVRIRTSAVKTS